MRIAIDFVMRRTYPCGQSAVGWHLMFENQVLDASHHQYFKYLHGKLGTRHAIVKYESSSKRISGYEVCTARGVGPNSLLPR